VLDFGEDVNRNGVLETEDTNRNGVLDSGEDVNGNGVLDFGEDINHNGVLDSEDTNHNGKLEPGNVIALSSGQVTTDSSGRATLSLVYAESYVPWVDVKLQVQARVSGTASLTEASFMVEGLSSDFTDEKVPPAGLVSPFGRRASCIDPL
jgi:hypothetical protein